MKLLRSFIIVVLSLLLLSSAAKAADERINNPVVLNARQDTTPVIQVTSSNVDYHPALVQASDGKLWVFFNSYRDNGFDYLWYRNSTDAGQTWSAAAPFTAIFDDDYAPSAVSAPDGKLWVVWYSYRSGNGDLWYKSSNDNGATWSADTQLTTDASADQNPAIARSDDGKLWVVWSSNRSGNNDLWYKTSSDSGVTWSADTQLTTDPNDDKNPTIVQANNGTLWVVWERNGYLWYRNSSDGGATWSAEAQISGTCCHDNPSLAVAADGTLWLASDHNNDIWYQTSTDNGTSWPTPARFTRYVSTDVEPSLVSLTDGHMAVAWTSDRGQQWWSNVWYGVFGVFEDINPPPSEGFIGPQPSRPLTTDVVTISVDARDESPGLSVELIWSKDGVSQSNLPMYDDGTHGDATAGDNRYSVQIGPFPVNTVIQYQAQATDSDGNVIVHPTLSSSFQVIEPFTKTADILFVPDYGGYGTGWFRSYYTQALDALGYHYDVWDTELRGAPDSSVLNQYSSGVVIWAMPHWGYLSNDSTTRDAMQSYLDAGGKLFISGQDVANNLNGTTFLTNYLHATFKQNDTGLYGLNGAAGDPIGDGLALNVSGGDGANNQYSKDEVDPISPAVAVFSYDTNQVNMLSKPTLPKEAAHRRQEPQNGSHRIAAESKITSRRVEPAGIISSGTAGLRVDTGTYKVVYFAFGFEGINSVADRTLVMERTLSWLGGRLPRPTQISPANGAAVPVGSVSFTWSSMVGVTNYQVQIDTTAAFTSTALISNTVSATSQTASLSQGTWYWRVRALPGGEWTTTWEVHTAGPVVQVTTGLSGDYDPAIVHAADGTLWVVWSSDRSGNNDIWYKTSNDGGATWSAAAQLTIDSDYDGNPTIIQTANGSLWVTWLSHRSGNWDIWYRTSNDGGATWSAAAQITTDAGGDYSPAITQTADGKLWVTWESDRSGNGDIWYQTSSDGGATWSAAAQLTTDVSNDYAPAITQTADGKLWIIWSRCCSGLWYKTSNDGGATWSTATQLTTGGNDDSPDIAQAVDGTLWVTWASHRSGNWDIWYETSHDNGATWSAPVQWTRFVHDDGSPYLASLANGRVGLVWQSDRSGNYDIWFGIPGQREDINPPPYIAWIQHSTNPTSANAITIWGWAQDETGLSNVEMLWGIDGVAQTNLTMYDDGTHGDVSAGDNVYSVQIGPLTAGSSVTYTVRATDVDSNHYTYPGMPSFQVLEPFTKTADILLVPDHGGDSTGWFRPYYTQALDALGYHYDVWDTELRGAPDSSVLNQYLSGIVIWAMPYWISYLSSASTTRDVLQSYLDAGGKLFVSGQDVANDLNGTTFLTNYLHATFKQNDTGLYGLNGAAGDPIGDGLALNLSGGDGANNQYSKDEVDPVSPAVAVFRYDTNQVNMLSKPTLPKEAADRRQEPQNGSHRIAAESKISSRRVEPAGIISSGTAGLRVDTGTYKVVYFAFGFEGINSAADRTLVMERTLSWLGGRLPRPLQISPANGVAVPVGSVTFTWSSVVGVTNYQVQIDTTAAFTSTALISNTVSATSQTASLSQGTWYWRVRALPGGEWTTAWEVHTAGPVVQVTTGLSGDYDPAIVHAADGTLWVVWSSDRSGNNDIWYKTSNDSGATWSAAAQLTIDSDYDGNPAIIQTANGTLWVVWSSDRSGNNDIWYKTSNDGGATWSAAAQITTDAGRDYSPAITQTADGKLWVTWLSYRSGNGDIWYKTSSDGGVTWSAAAQLTTDANNHYYPAITQAADGTLWIIWLRCCSGLWYKTSHDGGATWSSAVQLTDDGNAYGHDIAQAADGTLWVAWHSYRSGNWDIWYETSHDNGATWSAPVQWTRFVGVDEWPYLASLANGRVGLVWQSDRSGNYDIWFGIPGQREDINPPPYVAWIQHSTNPTSANAITIWGWAQDETGLSNVEMLWGIDGVAQTNLTMYDDGTHGDVSAGDDVYTVQIGPFSAGTEITYTIQATDVDINSYTARTDSFRVLEPFAKTADILFVPDNGGYGTGWFRSYYTQTLDALGVHYDVWDTELRGAPDSGVLNQYSTGVVIWAMPDWNSYLSSHSTIRDALQSYLDAGGKLFISGQDVASHLNGGSFLTNYLHAAFKQGDTGLYGLNGAAGDPIGDGLALNLSGGDGANDQYSKDEVDPISPAVAVFSYDTNQVNMLSKPTLPKEVANWRQEPQNGSHRVTAENEISSRRAEPAGIISSGTAGLRVDTGTYKVVFFAFGFEGINSAADRQEVMRRVLVWLAPGLLQPCYDFDGSGQVGAADVQLVASHWHQHTGDAGWDLRFDVNHDGVINVLDVLKVAAQVGRMCP